MTVQNETLKLAVFATAFVFVLAVAAGSVAGLPEMKRAVIAGLISALPALGTYIFTVWAYPRGTVWQLSATLGGTSIRSFVTLAAGLILYLTTPVCQSYVFWLWTAFAYMVMLVAEVVFTLRVNHRYHGRDLSASGQHQV
jgi:bacteriorhodopsin